MTWAQRLKRVFTIDIEICSECGGNVKILTHLKGQAVPEQAGLLPSV